jgi:hypothetical protein
LLLKAGFILKITLKYIIWDKDYEKLPIVIKILLRNGKFVKLNVKSGKVAVEIELLFTGYLGICLWGAIHAAGDG